jgi:hypothetical protein
MQSTYYEYNKRAIKPSHHVVGHDAPTPRQVFELTCGRRLPNVEEPE